MSKKLMITGLAQETDFDDIERAKTVLIINNGALRIPIDEDSVRRILEYAVESQPHKSNGSGQDDSHDDSLSSDEEEAYEKLADTDDVLQDPEETEELVDEAGIPQL